MMKRRPAAWESQPQEVAAAEQSAEERRLSLPVAGTTRGGWGSRQSIHWAPGAPGPRLKGINSYVESQAEPSRVSVPIGPSPRLRRAGGAGRRRRPPAP